MEIARGFAGIINFPKKPFDHGLPCARIPFRSFDSPSARVRTSPLEADKRGYRRGGPYFREWDVGKNDGPPNGDVSTHVHRISNPWKLSKQPARNINVA